MTLLGNSTENHRVRPQVARKRENNNRLCFHGGDFNINVYENDRTGEELGDSEDSERVAGGRKATVS